MTILKRIEYILIALIQILCGLIIIIKPGDGYSLVVWIISISFAVNGLGNIIYYMTLARYMVGGKTILYKGIIMLDFGIATLTLVDFPRLYIFLYMIGCYIFSGIVHMLRAWDARRLQASWKLNFGHGLGSLLIAAICLFYHHIYEVLALVYGIGLIYSALISLVNACRKTAIVYIQ